MKKMKLLAILLLVTFAFACGQKADDTFTKPIHFPQGIYIGTDTELHLTWPTGTGSVTWNDVLEKPLTFTPSAHNHDLLYKAITYTATWAGLPDKPSLFSGKYTDLTEKPTEIELQLAISQLDVIVIPKKTTAEIALMTPTAGSFVYDVTLNVLKIGNGTVFKVLITAN